jgi:hypothetical protein
MVAITIVVVITIDGMTQEVTITNGMATDHMAAGIIDVITT